MTLPSQNPAARDADGLPFIRNLPLEPAWLAAWHEEALEPDLPIIDPHHHLARRLQRQHVVPPACRPDAAHIVSTRLGAFGALRSDL
jgi:hypothetical protein